MQRGSFKKAVLIILIAAFIISCVPMAVNAFFANPCIDDYYYSVKTHAAWRDTGSGFEVFRAAAGQVKETYQQWQGTFSAVFLFALQPGIAGGSAYVVTPFIMLVAFIGGTILLARAVLIRRLRLCKVDFWLITVSYMTLSLQTLPSAVQGLFWYNGAMYYTFFYALMCVLFALVLNMDSVKQCVPFVIYGVSAAVLAFIIGGGNYVTALLSICCTAGFTVWKMILRDKRFVMYGVITLCAAVALAVSAAAPGNAVRAACYPLNSNRRLTTVPLAIFYAARYLCKWSTVTVVMITLALLPLIFRAAKNSDIKFKRPFWNFFITLALFTVQFAPAAYGMGTEGAERLLNIIYFSFFWFVCENVFYLCGWLARKGVRAPEKIIKHYKSVAVVMVVIAVLAPFTVTVTSIDIKCAADTYTSTSALYSLVSGESQAYNAACKEREKMLSSDEADVVLPPLSPRPYTLYYGDLTGDPNYEWSNAPIAEYYNKNSVIVDWK